MTNLTRAELENLKRLAELATQGPWEYNNFKSSVETVNGRIATMDGGYHSSMSDQRIDGAFIAAANPAVITSLVSRLIEAEDALAYYARGLVAGKLAKEYFQKHEVSE